MHLKIVNFEKFNPRKDRTHHHWFRLENNIFVSSALFDLDPDQKWFWIFLLAYVSQKQTTDGIEVTPSLFAHLSGLTTKRVNQTLELFQRKGLVTITSDTGNQVVTDRGLHNRTEQDITNKTIQAPAIVFDFELVYKNYPLKKGKSKGIEKLKREIQTSADYDALNNAVLKYAESVKGSDPKFIKHFSTFVSEWRDWLDPETGTSTVKPSTDTDWDYVFGRKGAANA